MIIALLLVLFNVFLLIFPRIVLTASREGLLLWFNNVLPGLLPFMIATNMLILSGYAKSFAKIFSPFMQKFFRLPGEAGIALFVGLTSGYPVGAKTVADLQRAGQISGAQAQHLLAFCNNAGPIFILGVVGAGMFQSAQVGYILWASHVLAAIITGISAKGFANPARVSSSNPVRSIANALEKPVQVSPENAQKPAISRLAFTVLKGVRNFCRNDSEAVRRISSNSPVSSKKVIFSKSNSASPDSVEKSHSPMPFARALSESVKNSMDAITIIGGLIIFFAVVVALIEMLPIPGAEIIASVFEVTNGSQYAAGLPHTAFSLGLAAFIIGFGGFSVHAQTAHFMAGLGINFGKYFLAKIFHGTTAAALTIFLHFILDIL
ncbi:MAG: hypothetical protein FWC70_07820 [Defluviitaleaceae bacterium]|nr:hypothetical protein [Defluviitaleaceae bacterium]